MLHRCLLLAAAVAAAASAHAQSSVWKVTRDGNTLYLGGTCHTLRASDLPLPAEYAVAFQAADALWFETDIAQMQSPEAQGKIMAHAMYTDGRTLPTVLSAEAWSALQEYGARAGMPVAQLESLRPSMLVLMIFAIEAQRLGFTPEGVDVQLDRQARQAGKPVAGLETVDEQIGFITSLGDGQESELVLSTIQDLERMPALLDEMIAAWRSGDLQKIDTLMSAEVRRDFPKVHEKLLVERNKAWLPRIEAMLASPPREFVLVGVGHIAGDDGLIHALERAGCTIEQVAAHKAD